MKGKREEQLGLADAAMGLVEGRVREGGFLQRLERLIEKLPGGEIKFYLSNLPASTPLKELVGLAHQRWKVEQGYQQLKEELGLDHFEGRSWRGLHHHITLCFMVYDFLTLLHRQHQKNASPGLLAVRRWLNTLLDLRRCLQLPLPPQPQPPTLNLLNGIVVVREPPPTLRGTGHLVAGDSPYLIMPST